MKKYLVLALLGISILSFSAVISQQFASESPEEEKTKYEVVHEVLHEKVYPKFYDLVDYKPSKRFSRCPSGFGERIDEELSNDEIVRGQIFYREGCSSDSFAFYELHLATKEVTVKATEEQDYASVEEFVQEYENDQALFEQN